MPGQAVVPFGKYKGQPVAALQADPQYMEWLVNQDWFRTRYTNLYQVIINHHGEPTETPEHNSLQVKFLDDAFCIKFIKFIHKSIEADCYKYTVDHSVRMGLEEYTDKFPEAERMYYITSYALPRAEEYLKRWSSDSFAGNDERRRREQAVQELKAIVARHAEAHKKIKDEVTEDLEGAQPYWHLRKEFETKGVDIRLTVRMNYHGRIDWELSGEYSVKYNIELKPTVGDDYPAVMRQMKVNGSSVLLVKEYTGTGATKEQFVATFRNEKLAVAFLADVEAS